MRTLGRQSTRQSGSGDSLGPCCSGVSPLQRLGTVVRIRKVPPPTPLGSDLQLVSCRVFFQTTRFLEDRVSFRENLLWK